MNIIAATDFSPAAENAVRSAARLSRRLGDRLVLVRAVEPPVAIYPELGLANVEVMDEALQAANRTSLEKARAALAAEGVDVEARLVVGVPDQVLTEVAGQVSARLIIMGTHGRSGAARLLLGSVATRTALDAPCPVLCLRAGTRPFDAWVSGERPLRVLMGIDQGPASEAALSWVSELRKVAPCDVVLMHEYWPPAEYTRLGLHGPRDVFATDPEVVAVLERELRARVGDLPGQGNVHLLAQAAWGRLGDVLASQAERIGADMLVVGSHQPHGWERLRGGSKAMSVLHTSSVPVLCVPERLRPASPLPWRVPVPTVRRVLVATDLTAAGNAAVPHAYALLRGCSDGVVELCHVHRRHVPSPIYAYDDKAEALSAPARSEIDVALRALIPVDAKAMGVTTHINIIDGGAPSDAIAQAARRLGADVIALAAHGGADGTKMKAGVGGIVDGVLRAADRPVHVVRG